jgi:GTP cyclohydrolase FolE2
MQQTKADLEAQMKKQLEELNDREQEAGNAKQITMKMNWMQELRSAISSSKKWRISSVTQQALWGENSP